MTTQGPHRFPPIPTGGWRDDAECARATDLTMWDGSIPGHESELAREARFNRAKDVCWRGGKNGEPCPVREKCAADVDWRYDEGVRAGHVLPPVRSANVSRRDKELGRLLRAGVPLDEAARVADRLPRRPIRSTKAAS